MFRWTSRIDGVLFQYNPVQSMSVWMKIHIIFNSGTPLPHPSPRGHVLYMSHYTPDASPNLTQHHGSSCIARRAPRALFTPCNFGKVSVFYAILSTISQERSFPICMFINILLRHKKEHKNKIKLEIWILTWISSFIYMSFRHQHQYPVSPLRGSLGPV